MGFKSRSDFFFNIREFAESLHAEDIKALNEGLGLGELKSSPNSLNPSEPVLKNHAQEQVKSEFGEIATVVTKPNSPRPLQSNPLPRPAKRNGKSFISSFRFKISRLLLRAGGHMIDLTVVSCFFVAVFLFVQRLAEIYQWELVIQVAHRVEVIRNWPLFNLFLFSLAALYVSYLVFWLSFKIVGLKTPGNAILVKAPNKDLSS